MNKIKKLRSANIIIFIASFLFIYSGRIVGNTVVERSCCSSSIFSIKNASSCVSRISFAAIFGARMFLQRAAGERNNWKIAKRIVLDLTFAERKAEIAIMKTYSPTLEKFTSKMSWWNSKNESPWPWLNPVGKVTNKLSVINWLNEAKLKARSEASRQNISNFNYWREASLRALSVAKLCIFSLFQTDNVLVTLPARVKNKLHENT